jgi:hypothetical protein
MTPSPDATRIVLEILKLGTLRVRSLGWAGDARRCAIEADHLHNLPDFLLCPSSALLSFYWEVEKPAFEGVSRDTDLAMFRPLWEELRPHVPTSSTAVA